MVEIYEAGSLITLRDETETDGGGDEVCSEVWRDRTGSEREGDRVSVSVSVSDRVLLRPHSRMAAKLSDWFSLLKRFKYI